MSGEEAHDRIGFISVEPGYGHLGENGYRGGKQTTEGLAGPESRDSTARWSWRKADLVQVSLAVFFYSLHSFHLIVHKGHFPLKIF